jgi:hypothetical protein
VLESHTPACSRWWRHPVVLIRGHACTSRWISGDCQPRPSQFAGRL